jgi:hypothetical protein
VIIARHLIDVLQPCQHDVDLVLLQPADGVPHGRFQWIDRDVRERVLGADLPQDEGGLIERDLGLDPVGGVGCEFA